MKRIVLILHFLALFFALILSVVPEKDQDGVRMNMFEELKSFEKEFQGYLEESKMGIEKSFHQDFVQSFQRSKLRKAFAFSRKSDLLDNPVRISIYEVRERGGKQQAREVFENFKPAVLWDKIIPALLNQALVKTGQETKGSGGGFSKFSEMAALLMPDSGKTNFTIPGQFIDLQLMGNDTLFYWNMITRRCPQRIQKSKGIKKCLKGLFLAEIDKRVLLRDFWYKRGSSPAIRPFVAFLDRSQERDYVFQLYPSNEAGNRWIFEAVQGALKSSFPVFEAREDIAYASVQSPGVKQAVIGLFGKWEGFDFPFPKQTLVLISVLTAISFLFLSFFCRK